MKMILPLNPADGAGTILPGTINPCGFLLLFNESSYGLRLQFADGSVSVLPPWFARAYRLPVAGAPIAWNTLYTLPGLDVTPASTVYGESYEPGEIEFSSLLAQVGPLVRQTFIGNSLPVGGGTTPPPPTGNPITFTPTQIPLSQELENALRGAQYYGSGAPPPGYPLSDRSLRFSWNRIETAQQVYDFTIIDNGLAAAASAGYKFGWRIMPINGGQNVPSYIPGTWSNGVYVPDWNSSAFLTAAQNLMNALSARYANDPRVGLLDMSLYGCWGEWNESCFSPSLAASASTRQQLIDMQYAAFPNKRFVMLTNWQDSLNYALNVTRNKPTGVRIDCLGTNSLGGAKSNLDNNSLERNRWQTAPLYFEYCANADFALGDSQVQQYCASIVGDGDGNVGDWSSYSSTQQQNLLNSYIHSGYRYWIASLTTVDAWGRGQGVQVSATWQNLNRAPVYDQFDIFYQLRVGASVAQEWQSSYDLRTLYSSAAGAQHTHTETLSVPTGLSAGTYTLAVIVRDHEGYYPAMHLSQQGRQSDGAYTLGQITVS